MTGIRSLFIALAALLWSADALFRQPLTQELSAITIVFSEHLFAMVFVVPLLWYYWSQLRALSLKQWGAVLVIGVAASALATVAFTAAFSYVGPSVAILLQKTQPLFTFLLAFIILREKLPKNFWWWASLGFVGAYLVSFPEIIPQLSFYQHGGFGVLLALTAALLWGSATVFGRYLLKNVSYPLVAALRFIVALPVLTLLVILNGGFGGFVSMSGKDVLFLIIIMFGPGFGAMYLYYRGLQVTRASVSAILELTWPLAAVVLNWIFLGDTLTWVQILGGLVLVGAMTKLTIWQKSEVSI